MKQKVQILQHLHRGGLVSLEPLAWIGGSEPSASPCVTRLVIKTCFFKTQTKTKSFKTGFREVSRLRLNRWEPQPWQMAVILKIIKSNISTTIWWNLVRWCKLRPLPRSDQPLKICRPWAGGSHLAPPPTIDQTSFFLLLYPYTLILRMLTLNNLGLNGSFVVTYAPREQQIW